MPQNLVLVHIKEETVKGMYRPLFERNLVTKLSKELKGLGHKSIKKQYQRIFIELDTQSKIAAIKEKLLNIKEINYFCFPEKIKNNFEEIKSVCLKMLESSKAKSFRPKIKITYKAYPARANEATEELGSYLARKTNKILDFVDAELIMYVEIMENAAYVYNTIYK